MDLQKISVLKIRHGKDPIIAVLQQNGIVWQALGFDSKELAIYKPKESYYAEVGDVLFADKDNNKEIYSRYADFDVLKEEGYRPIGLCIIPGKFNVYGNCAANFIALNYISEKTPEDGTPYEDEIVVFNTVDATYYNYGDDFKSGNGVAIVDDRVSKEIKGFYDQPILPTDYWVGSDEDYVSSNDGVGYYLRLGVGNNSNTNRAYSPSPYYKDQTQQELWWYSTNVHTKTSQTNFNGEELTNLYLSKFSGGRINGINYIKKYSPQNSNTAGEWFLGATGEMAIAACRFGLLNEVIRKLRLCFGFECAAFFQNKSLITSNIPDAANNTVTRLKCIGMKSVVISNTNIKADDINCRAMIKFENTANKVRINIKWNNYLNFVNLNGRLYYPWTAVDYIEMPIGSSLKWSAKLVNGYTTSSLLSGDFTVEEETTIEFNDIVEDLPYEITTNKYSIESYEAEVGDYLFVDDEGKLFLTKQSTSLDELKELGYNPIAVVITPGSHNIYGDCSVGCTALNYLSKTDNTGSDSPVGIKFCNSNNHGLPTQYPLGVSLNGPQTKNISGFIERPGIPSDYLAVSSTQPTSLDGETQYFQTKITSNLSVYGYCPSPYDENGDANVLYWYANSSNKLSAQRDVYGKENIKNLVNNFDLSQYPAVNYVAQYAPSCAPSTKGVWYIQGSGELPYLVNRMKKVINSLTNLSNTYEEVKVNANDFWTQDYWASTPLNDSYMRNGPGNNIWLIGCNDSTKELSIRPMIRIDSTTDKVTLKFDWRLTDCISVNGRVYYSWDNIISIKVKKGSTITWKTEDVNENPDAIGETFVIEKDETIPFIIEDMDLYPISIAGEFDPHTPAKDRYVYS